MEAHKTILVIEDSSVTLHFLSELLKGKGYKVLTARNGIQAIYTFENHNIDLVLLDLMQPDMSGLEVLEHIKSLAVRKTLPIMIVE
jgi:CheY-like chemotaxis protein